MAHLALNCARLFFYTCIEVDICSKPSKYRGCERYLGRKKYKLCATEATRRFSRSFILLGECLVLFARTCLVSDAGAMPESSSANPTESSFSRAISRSRALREREGVSGAVGWDEVGCNEERRWGVGGRGQKKSKKAKRNGGGEGARRVADSMQRRMGAATGAGVRVGVRVGVLRA
eukprot:1739618-Pleurochrysis_carterae.AAC.1